MWSTAEKLRSLGEPAGVPDHAGGVQARAEPVGSRELNRQDAPLPLAPPLQPHVRAGQLRRKRLHERDSERVDGVVGLEAWGPEACRAVCGLQEELLRPWGHGREVGASPALRQPVWRDRSQGQWAPHNRDALGPSCHHSCSPGLALRPGCQRQGPQPWVAGWKPRGRGDAAQTCEPLCSSSRLCSRGVWGGGRRAKGRGGHHAELPPYLQSRAPASPGR